MILRAMPGLWLGAAGALLVCTAVWLVPVFVALTGWTGPVWAFAAGLTTLVAVGGLARLSVTEDVRAARALGLGPAGLQFGWPEVRLVGSALFCLIFLAMIVIVLALLVLAIFGTAGLDVAAIQATGVRQVAVDNKDVWKRRFRVFSNRGARAQGRRTQRQGLKAAGNSSTK